MFLPSIRRHIRRILLLLALPPAAALLFLVTALLLTVLPAGRLVHFRLTNRGG